LREVREFALGRLASVPLLEPRGAAAQIRGDGFAARGEHIALLVAGLAGLTDPLPLATAHANSGP